MTKPLTYYPLKLVKTLKTKAAKFWQANWWHKVITVVLIFLVVTVGIMYGIAQWYIHSQANKPLQLGVSFIPSYARSLGLDPKDTMDGLLDINVKNFRLVSYWNETEPSPGEYNFSELDWQFQKAEAADAKIILTLGLRQPRWPECHMPDWASKEPKSVWQPQLEAFMAKTVERYKNSPSLAGYQLENEYFLQGFGICTDFSRDRLISEYNLIKKIDPSTPIIVPRSNNALGFPIGEPLPDEFSISIYKRVWDQGVTKRYLQYPFPAWFYGFLAGTQQIFLDRNMMIAELQAEAWPANGQPISDTSLAEQNKSINAERLNDNFEFGKDTGMKQINMWGAEYWYYRLIILDEPSLWNVAKQQFKQN